MANKVGNLGKLGKFAKFPSSAWVKKSALKDIQWKFSAYFLFGWITLSATLWFWMFQKKTKNIGLTIPDNCRSFIADFMKSGEFHVKSSGFHVKSWDITFPLHSIKLKSSSWIILFIRFSGGFHDFVKSAWNLLDFVKSAWNLPDFTWNSPDFTEIRKSAFMSIKKRSLSLSTLTGPRTVASVRSAWWKGSGTCCSVPTEEPPNTPGDTYCSGSTSRARVLNTEGIRMKRP